MFSIFLVALLALAHTSDVNAALVREWFDTQLFDWFEMIARCDTIVLLFTDANWLDLTIDLIDDLKRNGGYDKCVAVWYWQQQHASGWPLADLQNKLRAGTPLFVDNRTVAIASSAGDKPTWGEKQYFNKIAQRVPIAQHVLWRIPLRDVGLAVIDSDIAVFRNVFKRMKHERATLVVQEESVCSGEYRKCVNGGFWRVAGDEEGMLLLQAVTYVMDILQLPDQDAFDVVLSLPRKERTVVYLDRLKYANGFRYKNDTAWRRNAAHIVHVNLFCTLEEKRSLLRALRKKNKSI